MSEGNTVYNLLRSRDILWAGDITGTAQRITLWHVWARKLISSEAFARIFKPGHTYTLSYSGKVIEPAPDTAYREDRFGVMLYSPADWRKGFDVLEYHDNPPAGYTFHKSMTFTTSDSYPGDVKILAYSDYSRDESGAAHQGIVEISDLMIVEGSTPAAWAPAEGETLTADGGGGAMTEPTNLAKTQPDESHLYSATVESGHFKSVLYALMDDLPVSSTTAVHLAITVRAESGKTIDSGTLNLWVRYKDSSGAYNYAETYYTASTIGDSWTRIETTGTIPAGMTADQIGITLYKTASLYMTNLTVYLLTGGRIVRARGTTALVSVNDGAKGDQGIPGKDGKSPTVSVSKSGTVTTIVVTNADGSKTTQTVNDGVNGTPGAKGADGRTTYFHVKYSNDGGKTFTANSGETVGTYIGTCTDYNSADPTTVGSYTWARIKGDTGATGAKGADGVSPTVSISKSGSTTTISITDKNGTHTQTVLDGTNGTPGAKGADGKTSYLHVKYSNDGGKTFTTNSGETVGDYIGTCTDFSSADPTTVSSYTWAKIKGATGATGPKGETGATGKGATSIIEQYYLSTSSTTQAGGSWSTTQPTWSSGKYIWTRSHITWTDGTTTDTTPVLAGGLNSANQNAFNANNTANNANNTANSAQSTANSAQSTANSAQSTANSKNAIFYAETAPSGSHKVNDVWFDTAHGNKMYYWTGSTWSSGLFDTAAIKDGAVTGKLIAGQTITGDKIASRTIVATNIAAATITANEILGGTITADKIASRTLTADKIKAGAITSNEIAAGTITANNIASRAITADRIKAGAITSNEIAAGTITANNIASRAITADRIKAGALTATEIAAGTITADKVNMDSLQTNIGYIGNKSGRHVEITSDAVKLMLDGATILGSFGSGGISLGNVFSVDPSGNGAYSGKITAKSGTIGGWTIDSSLDGMSRSTTSGSRTTKSLLADGKYAIYGNETVDDVVYNVSHTYDFTGYNYTRSWQFDDLSHRTCAILGYNEDVFSDYIFHMYNTGTTEEILMEHGGIRITGDLRVGADVTWAPGSYPAQLRGNVRANTFNSIELKNLIKIKYLTASNKKFVKNGSSNNTISVPTMSGYNLMGVYDATIDSDKVYPYNCYYDAGNKVFHVLGHNISGADVTTAIHGIAFYIANV